MYITKKSRMLGVALALLAATWLRPAGAAPVPTAAGSSASVVVPASVVAPPTQVASATSTANGLVTIDKDHHGNDLVSFGHDSQLGPDRRAEAVVSIFGSSNSAGRANDVVSLFGNTSVTGAVDGDAVAVFGDTSVDSKTRGDAVAVFGSVHLGPHADVRGDVVAIGGTVVRDPGSIVHGQTQDVQLGPLGDFHWLQPWIAHCLLYGRPLAIAPGLGWAWWVAGGFIALYVLLALWFRDGLMRCVTTLESRPGQTVVASLLTLLAMPVLLLLLVITVVGAFAVPFVVVSLACAQLFGKAVALAWLGRTVTARRDSGPFSHPAAVVLLGGLITTGAYLVPVLGFIVLKALSVLGLGAVVYTLILIQRDRQARIGGPRAAAAATAAPATGTPATDAATDAATGAAASAVDATAVAGDAPAPVNGSVKAGFWVRIAALLIDAILVGVLASLIGNHAHAFLLVLAAYGAVMWKLRGSTVGGIILHQRVVRADGRELDWPTAIVRALACFLSLAVAGLGFIWIAIDRDRQAWHDKIAGTIVVRAPPRSLV